MGKWKKINYPIFAAIIAFVLGSYGLYEYYESMGVPYHWADIFYGSLQLFPINSGGIEVGKAHWTLHFARFLAPAVTVYAIVVFATMLGKDYISRISLKNHVIICGFGYHGEIMLRHYSNTQKQTKIVIIEYAPTEERETLARSYGVIWIVGDAANKAILKEAKLKSAKEIAVTWGNDGSNLVVVGAMEEYLTTSARANSPIEHAKEVAITCDNDGSNLVVDCAMEEYLTISATASATASSPPGIKCHVQTKMLAYENMCTMLDALCGEGSKLDAQPFDPDMAIAYKTLGDIPLDFKPIPADSVLRVQLVLVGWSHFSEIMAIATANIAHYANDVLPRIVFFNVPPECISAFCVRYPYAEKAVEFAFAPHPLESVEGIAFLRNKLTTPNMLSTLLFCHDDAAIALNQAMNLPLDIRDDIKNMKHQCIIRINDTDADALIEKLKGKTPNNFELINALPHDLGVTMEIDNVAKEINTLHKRKSWNKLDLHLKQSNRLAALHLTIKVRAIKYASKEEVDKTLLKLTDDKICLLAKMEHRRWLAEKHLTGWTYNCERNDSLRQHPDLVLFSELQEKSLKYNIKIAYALPELIKKLHKSLYRL